MLWRDGIRKCNSNCYLRPVWLATSPSPALFSIYPTAKKMSWMHPHSKHWHLMDYIIVRHLDRQTVTKTMCGADWWTRHRVLISKMKLGFQMAARKEGTYLPQCSKAEEHCHQTVLCSHIGQQLPKLGVSGVKIKGQQGQGSDPGLR